MPEHKAKLLDGKKLSEKVLNELQPEVQQFLRSAGRAPKLEVLLVGDSEASLSYVKIKSRVAAAVGIDCTIHRMPVDAGEHAVLAKIHEFNQTATTDAVILQLPLPPDYDEHKLLQTIAPTKDVDGLNAVNLGLLTVSKPRFVPATPLGIHRLLGEAKVNLDGANVVIVGRSYLVSRPLSVLLSSKAFGGNATVTLCHSATKDLSHHTRNADVLIVAAGQPNLLGASDVKPDTVVIDVGVNQIADASRASGVRLVGDVRFDEVRLVASAITPVPGGVGPMTVALLMQNVVKAANLNRNL